MSRARSILSDWCPGGRVIGQEYTAASVSGGRGESFKFNINTGLWSDFASGQSGGDLVSLYAEINGLSQIDAARRLISEYGLSHATQTVDNSRVSGARRTITKPSRPPANELPNTDGATHVWTYRDAAGAVLFYIARYDGPDGKKSFRPYTWTNSDINAYQAKAWPEPRPLYNLDGLAKHPNKPVLITEGEKSSDAAAKITGDKYVAMTWSGGVNAHKKTDFTPLQGRSILLWPDADKPGIKAMNEIAEHLHQIGVKEIKIIDTSDHSDGWDAADSGFTWTEFVAWAKPRAILWKPAPIKSADPEVRKVQAELVGPVSDDVPHPAEIDDETRVEKWEFLGLPVPKDRNDAYKECRINLSGDDSLVPNVSNADLIVDRFRDYKNLIWIDDFHRKMFTKWQSTDGQPREWTDADDLNLLILFQRFFGFDRMTPQTAKNIAILIANKNHKNEPKEWMESLEWDQKPRIESFLTEYFGVPLGEYCFAVSKNFWISMVARIFKPGCQVDNMVILEADQGKFKSSALNIIGGKWYTEIHGSLDSKDFLLATHGKLLIEIGELEGFQKADVNFLKKLITTRTDRFRAPYGHRAEDFPRQFVLTGTTNDSSYLRDQTGNRRYWPVRVGEVKLDQLARDRDQLFAEAVHGFKNGSSWWSVPLREAEIEQSSRIEIDPWRELIEDYVFDKSTIRVNDLMERALKVDACNRAPHLAKRVAGILRSLKWEFVGNRRIDGKQGNTWVKVSKVSEG